MWAEPSLDPRSGSSIYIRSMTATAASTGVTLKAQCHEPNALAVSEPTIYLKLESKTQKLAFSSQ